MPYKQESYEPLGDFDTGACSLTIISGVQVHEKTKAVPWGGYTKAGFFADLLKIIENTVDNEPHTFLCYLKEEYTTAVKWLEEFGFVTLETLPGGHGDYLMNLMMYTKNPDIQFDGTKKELPKVPGAKVLARR